jgi:outer membrane protein TolC
MTILSCLALRAGLFFAFLATTLPGLGESLPLKRAVQLALTHSTTAGSANADEQRAFASYREARNAYIPSVVVGAGLGKSWGFPLSLEGSAPSLFNINAQSVLFNPAQREFLKAARIEYQASKLDAKDQREQVIQDTVTTYTELVNWEQRLGRLQQEEAEASKMEQAVAERVKEGVDSALDMNKARLASARVRLRLAQARGSADVLRQHLAQLTGVRSMDVETVQDSIPPMPAVNQGDDLATAAAKSSPAVQLAEQHSIAAAFRARGQHRALLPSFDFAAQYALLSKYNNYDVYYNAFQRNNATVGVSIVFPFLNFSQRARANAADAEALKAKKQVEAAKNQVTEEALKLQRSVGQLAAARDVADLEYQVAQSGLEAAQSRVEASTATLHELDDARAQANERYLAARDAALELDRARIALMRSTAELEKWALGTPD